MQSSNMKIIYLIVLFCCLFIICLQTTSAVPPNSKSSGYNKISCHWKKPCAKGKCTEGTCYCGGRVCDNQRAQGRSSSVLIPCTNSTDCPENASCASQNSKCFCDSGYVMSTNNTCLEEQHNYEGKCQEKIQCKLENTDCKDEKCQCAESYKNMNGTCVKSQTLNSKPCNEEKDCDEFGEAECNTISQTCKCKKSKIANMNETRCINSEAKPGEECNNDEMCSVKKQNCIDNICKCPENQHINQKQTDCIPDKNLGDSCTESDECYFFDEENQRNALECKTNCTCAEEYKLTTEGNNQTCIFSGSSSIFNSNLGLLVFTTYFIHVVTVYMYRID